MDSTDRTPDAAPEYPHWWDDVAGHYGALRAIGLLHPGEGVILAIRDLGVWVSRHPKHDTPADTQSKASK